MKGDFSRDTFDPRKNFSRVLMQQGRVQLDADWNEQAAIVLYYLRALAKDLIGQHGGPAQSFAIKAKKEKNDLVLTIEPGHYYVDGILCHNEVTLDEKGNPAPVTFFNQPNSQTDSNSKLPPPPFLAYLDVWERHITCFEDESLCEVALGGIDTTTRTKVMWQVKLFAPSEGHVLSCNDVGKFPTMSDALLRARAQPAQTSDDPCLIEPDAQYRGAENQLYRVEIHTGNVDQQGILIENAPQPTFKWSRENGAVVFPVVRISRNNNRTTVELATLGRDDTFALREGDWVEIVDDAYSSQNRAEKLLQVSIIDRDELTVILDGTTNVSVRQNPSNHPLLRRWDQRAGDPTEGGLILGGDNAALIPKDMSPNDWLTLEDGVQIQFPHPDNKPRSYRTGDYWLIPARVATGDVVWPKDAQGNSLPQPPRGVEHHYAPLGIVLDDAGHLHVTDCRCTLGILAKCPHEGPALHEGAAPQEEPAPQKAKRSRKG